MKLEEFVTKIYDERPELDMTPSFGPILNSKVLEEVKDELLKFDVFSECDDLEIVHYPTFKVGNDKVLTTQTFKYIYAQKIQWNKDGNIYKSKALKWQDKRTINL